MSVFDQTLTILSKDLRIEWRGRARVVSVMVFSAVILLLFSFAVGPDSTTLAKHASGYYWLALLLTSVLALGDTWRVETEDDALDALMLLPVDPRALFLGKALARTAALTLHALILAPFAAGLFQVSVQGSSLHLAGFIALGVAGLSAPGILYGAMTATVRGRDVLLPLMLFPLVVPVLLAAVKGTSLALAGDPMDQAGSWLGVLAVFDVVYWCVCPLVFGAVIER